MTAIYFGKKQVYNQLNLKVLIYGGNRAVGSSAVSIAKYHNAHVTAVCGEEGVDMSHETW